MACSVTDPFAPPAPPINCVSWFVKSALAKKVLSVTPFCAALSTAWILPVLEMAASSKSFCGGELHAKYLAASSATKSTSDGRNMLTPASVGSISAVKVARSRGSSTTYVEENRLIAICQYCVPPTLTMAPPRMGSNRNSNRRLMAPPAIGTSSSFWVWSVGCGSQPKLPGPGAAKGMVHPASGDVTHATSACVRVCSADSA